MWLDLFELSLRTIFAFIFVGWRYAWDYPAAEVRGLARINFENDELLPKKAESMP